MDKNYTICVCTFLNRYRNYFLPLISNINQLKPDIEKIIFINGQHKQNFNKEYKKNILQIISSLNETYPIVSPFFRGCSFMWNTCINYSSSNYILLLNDDIVISDKFFKDVENIIETNPSSFTINNSFSHFCVNRNDINNVGYFDEHLIGIGEEDGDWLWRWEQHYSKPIPNFNLDSVLNVVDKSDYNLQNIKKVNGKYSAFNRSWLFDKKYHKNENGYRGRFDYNVFMNDEYKNLNLYPCEKWYRDNIKEI
jgi:GR25 family glycosyltransferase involved in LPS biosynthesis